MSLSDHNSNPFNALPPVVVALAVALFAIELLFQAGTAGIVGGAAGVGLRIEALNGFAFSPQLWDRMVEVGQFPPRQLLRLVSYSFVHLGFTHMLFVVVFLLAMGKLVAESFAAWAVLAVWAASSIAGALVYSFVPGAETALVGGYPAVYGLIGCYTFLMWTGLGAMGEDRIRAFTLIAFLLGIQLVFGLFFGGSATWVADLAGFVAGFLLSFIVSPGGWSRVMQKIRQR